MLRNVHLHTYTARVGKLFGGGADSVLFTIQKPVVFRFYHSSSLCKLPNAQKNCRRILLLSSERIR